VQAKLLRPRKAIWGYAGSKQGLIIRSFHNFFLESDEGKTPFTVEQWHADVKYTEETIC
jgi:hypothetical protein